MAFLAVSVAAGCDRNKERSASVASDPQVGTVPPIAAPALAPGSVALEVRASDPRVKVTAAGMKQGETVSASGRAGFLIYGPYAPLGPGKYSLILTGTSTTPFTVDVAHDAGKSIAAKKDFPNTDSVDGSLPTVDFELAAAVTAIEFRVTVAAGSDTKVSSYKVVAR